MRLPVPLAALALAAVLCACGGGFGSSADGISLRAHVVHVPAISPSSRGSVPEDITTDTMSDGGDRETVSILVLVAPARAALVQGQKIELTALTDDRFGVSWSVSPAAGTIAPSSSFNNVPVVFIAPQKPGIYTVTATSMTNPNHSSAATIAVTDFAGQRSPVDAAARGLGDIIRRR